MEVFHQKLEVCKQEMLTLENVFEAVWSFCDAVPKVGFDSVKQEKKNLVLIGDLLGRVHRDYSRIAAVNPGDRESAAYAQVCEYYILILGGFLKNYKGTIIKNLVEIREFERALNLSAYFLKEFSETDKNSTFAIHSTLAILSLKGMHVEKSLENSLKEYEIALSIAEGSKEVPDMSKRMVIYNLGKVHEEMQNLEKAMECFLKSDTPSAHYDIGYFYENGIHVQKDLVTALSWYQKCALSGDEAAIEKVEELKNLLNLKI